MSPHYNNRSFVNAVIAAHSAGLSTPSPTEDTLDWKPCLSFYIPGPSSAVPGPQELYVYISVGRLQTRKSLVPFPGTGPCPSVPSCSLPCLLRTRIPLLSPGSAFRCLAADSGSHPCSAGPGWGCREREGCGPLGGGPAGGKASRPRCCQRKMGICLSC